MGKIKVWVGIEPCGWFVLVKILSVLGYKYENDFCVYWSKQHGCDLCPLDNRKSPLYIRAQKYK